MSTPSVKALRWWMIGLLMLGSVINYLTRSTLAVAAPTVLEDLDITTQQYRGSWRPSRARSCCSRSAGYILDVIGLKLGFAMFAVAWSFISMAHGLATAGRRSRPARAAGTLRRLGQPGRHEGDVGVVPGDGARAGRRRLQHRRVARIDARGADRRLGDPSHNWQFAFVMTGMLGLMWVGVWLWLYQSPATHPRCRPKSAITSRRAGEAPPGGRGGPRSPQILHQRNFWGIALPRFLADPTWGTLTFWLPLYLTTCAASTQADRALCVAAVSGGRPRLHVRRGDQHGAAEVLWGRAHQRPARRVHGRCNHDARRGIRRLRRQSVRRDRAAQPRPASRIRRCR